MRSQEVQAGKLSQPTRNTSLVGGMADAGDLNSPDQAIMWVRVPHWALVYLIRRNMIVTHGVAHQSFLTPEVRYIEIPLDRRSLPEFEHSLKYAVWYFYNEAFSDRIKIIDPMWTVETDKFGAKFLMVLYQVDYIFNYKGET
jgi:hypothetical protein